MNFPEAVRYLLSLGRELAAPTQASAAKFNLENIAVLAAHLGHPERNYPSAHIAGTNGKGSTAAFLESILRIAGRRTGLYTSPHLERINERIRVHGQEISDELFAQVFSRLRALVEKLLADGTLRAHPTFFECVTAMAFLHFREAGVDFAVFETGLGGRLDSTNIITPEISIITRIEFDHEDFLGHSLREISGEKAGIIKPEVPVVLARQREEAMEVLLQTAHSRQSPVIETAETCRIESLWTEEGCVRADVREKQSGRIIHLAPQLAGQFQLENALTAVTASQVLRSRGLPIDDRAIEQGIAAAVWPGRIEKIHSRPAIYLDGAHNPSAARQLAAFLTENLAGRRVFMLFGVLRDKAVDEIAGSLFPHAAHVILTAPATTRALSAKELGAIAGHHAAGFEVIPDADRALDAALARAGPDDAIVITGSLYLIGQLRGRLRGSSEARS